METDQDLLKKCKSTTTIYNKQHKQLLIDVILLYFISFFKFLLRFVNTDVFTKKNENNCDRLNKNTHYLNFFLNLFAILKAAILQQSKDQSALLFVFPIANQRQVGTLVFTCAKL